MPSTLENYWSNRLCDAKFSRFQDGVEITQEGIPESKQSQNPEARASNNGTNRDGDQVTSSDARAITFRPETEIDLTGILWNGA